MPEKNLAEISAPPRLAKVTIAPADRQPIMDYFLAKLDGYGRYSSDGSVCAAICYILKTDDDPIRGIDDMVRRQFIPGVSTTISPIYAEALEMLYSVRHRLEAELIARTEAL